MHFVSLGEGERLTDQAAEPVPERAIEALHQNLSEIAMQIHGEVARRLLLFVGLLVMTGACADRSPVPDPPVQNLDPATSQASSSTAVGEVLEWGKEIVLEENFEVLNVSPMVRTDPETGFLVADPREAQFRLYDPSGNLVHYFGSRGGGPQEFSRPAVAVRLPSGSILAVDGRAKAAIFNPQATDVERTFQTPFVIVYDVDLLEDDQALISGLTADQGSTRLHMMDLETGDIVRSFFPRQSRTRRGIRPPLGHPASRLRRFREIR